MELSPLTDSFVFGLASSLHCAGMCGPLGACFLGRGGGSGAIRTASVYQGARIASYALVGAILGGLSGAVGTVATGTPVAVTGGGLALALGALLLLGALGVHKVIRTPSMGGGLVRKVWGWALSRPPAHRAATLGFVTPALPCGVLWVMYGTAAATGSAADGSLAALGFGLGSLPLLWLAQAQLVHLQRWLGPRGLGWLQILAMASAAAVLIWRGWSSLAAAPGASPCCH